MSTIIAENVTCGSIVESTTTHESLFGALTYVAVIPGTVSILIIIFAVLFLEKAISHLEELASDSAFAHMLTIIEKELMIVGLTAFVFKSVQSSGQTINPEWYLCLEFADTFIPVTAFLFCFQGMLFIIMATYQTKLWAKGYQLHVFEILSQFYGGYSLNMDRFRWFYYYFSPMLSRTEFRIVHILFCKEFNLEPHAFEFDEYMIRVFEKFIISIIEVKPENWIVVCVIVLLNWLRIYLKIFTTKCKEDSCIVLEQITMFTTLGSLIFTLNLILLMFSLHYESQYMAVKGVHRIKDYGVFLEENEDVIAAPARHENKSARVQPHKISKDDLQKLAKSAKMSTKLKPKVKINHVFRIGSLLRMGLESVWKQGIRKSVHKTRSSLGTSMMDIWQLASIEKIRANFNLTASSRYTVHPNFNKLFLFHYPALYFAVVEHMLMVISLYCGLWITNFQFSVSRSISGNDKSYWQLYSALPGLLSVGLFILIVKSAAFLRAITTLDGECVHQTIEQAEASNELALTLRATMLQALGYRRGSSRSGKYSREITELRSLFKEAHDDEASVLTRLEFQIFLRKLGIDFSDKRWTQIFRQIDRNHDDEISLNELMLFLFPENKTAKAEEHDHIRHLARVAREKSGVFSKLIGADDTSKEWNQNLVGFNRKSMIQMDANKSRYSMMNSMLSQIRNTIGTSSKSAKFQVHPHHGDVGLSDIEEGGSHTHSHAGHGASHTHVHHPLGSDNRMGIHPAGRNNILHGDAWYDIEHGAKKVAYINNSSSESGEALEEDEDESVDDVIPEGDEGNDDEDESGEEEKGAAEELTAGCSGRGTVVKFSIEGEAPHSASDLDITARTSKSKEENRHVPGSISIQMSSANTVSEAGQAANAVVDENENILGEMRRDFEEYYSGLTKSKDGDDQNL